MNISIVNALYSEEELIDKLRGVCILEDRKVFPYRDATITLETLAIEELFPAQRYVLKSELEKVRELKWELELHGYNLFKLNGYVDIEIEDGTVISVLPPVVEECITPNGRILHIINDGMHRCYMAYLEWVNPQVVFIRGLPKSLPYYAHAIPEQDWKAIKILDEIPENFIKKWHRIEQNKWLYRDFNSAFQNVGGPRGSGKKELEPSGFEIAKLRTRIDRKWEGMPKK